MRRLLSAIVAAFVAAPVLAQDAPATQPAQEARPAPTQEPRPPRPGRAAEGEPKASSQPQVEARLRAVCKQLDLTPDQWKQVDTLMQICYAELEEARKDPGRAIEEIRQKYGELRDARNSGDKEREKQLKEELRKLAPGTRAEEHFYDGLTPILTDAQKTQLEKIRRLETIGGSLRPVDVLKAARAPTMKLSPEQERQLENVNREMRSRQASAPAGTNQAQRVDEYITEVRKLLTTGQNEEFDRQLELMRLTVGAAPPASAEKKPATQPTTAPGGNKP
jgi:hypothetical protein